MSRFLFVFYFVAFLVCVCEVEEALRSYVGSRWRFFTMCGHVIAVARTAGIGNWNLGLIGV